MAEVNKFFEVFLEETQIFQGQEMLDWSRSRMTTFSRWMVGKWKPDIHGASVRQQNGGVRSWGMPFFGDGPF